MQIFIFRHGEKENTFDLDPDLTSRGLQQAKQLANLVRGAKLPTPDVLITSPKVRTQRSFQELSKETQIKISTSDLLLERHNNESRTEFRKRVTDLLMSIQNSEAQCVFICSHYDWALESMIVIPSDRDLTSPEFMHWHPLQFVGFRVQNGIFHFLKIGTCDPTSDV